MTKITFRVITDIIEAQKIWELLSPKKSLYDDWNFRYTFYKYYKPEILFQVGYVDEKPIGLLPLQHEAGITTLDFFGGDYMEDNRVFILPGYEEYLPEFYHSLTEKVRLDFITGEDEFTKQLPFSDYKYILPLHDFTSSDEYIQKYFQGETKKKLIKRLKKVAEHQIEILSNQWDDIELLFEFNIQKFQDHSMFLRPFRKEIFRDFISATSFQTRLITFVVDGVKQAVSMSIMYNGIYASMNTGVHPEAVKDLSSYIHVKKIDDALQLNMKVFDAFVRNYGWKENWKFVKIPQYKFEN